jgi:hypothetical protein
MSNQTNQNEKELIQNIPLKQLAEKGVLPDRLGKTTRKRDKIDEDFARCCRESQEKIPVAPLTTKEKELLQKTLTKDALSEADFAIMAIRQKLRSTNPTGPFQDDRRPLSPSYF